MSCEIAGNWKEPTRHARTFIPIHRNQSRKVEIMTLKWVITNGRNYKHRSSRISIFPENILYKKWKVLTEGHVPWLAISYATGQTAFRRKQMTVTLGAYDRFRWQFNSFVQAYCSGGQTL